MSNWQDLKDIRVCVVNRTFWCAPPNYHLNIIITTELKDNIAGGFPFLQSTYGTSSAAGKSGSLSLDALDKAKKALQMQKELSEKLKKIPLVRRICTVKKVVSFLFSHVLNKGTSSDGSSVSGLKDGEKVPSSGTGIMQGTGSTTANTLSFGAMPSSSNLQAAAAVSVKPPASGVSTIPGLTNIPNIEAVKRARELAAKMGFRQDP
ncbi:hypothetical protein Pint_09315 [Pistacia integerrima]|uniref:Uncharacterized protein n=1 Tax=Pistacia integerrima TaxID=434235 RepID=A0ACC0XRU5_9ROSI|nr:hypothetical protein Pint_09315 [Pistacia integerrima]